MDCDPLARRIISERLLACNGVHISATAPSGLTLQLAAYWLRTKLRDLCALGELLAIVGDGQRRDEVGTAILMA